MLTTFLIVLGILALFGVPPNCAVPDYRRDCGVARVLWRVKRSFPALFIKNVAKKGCITLPF